VSRGAPAFCRLLLCAPFPIPDFRQVFAVLVNVLLVLDELVLELLLQVLVMVLPLERFAEIGGIDFLSSIFRQCLPRGLRRFI
jgi:hypothetical protein